MTQLSLLLSNPRKRFRKGVKRLDAKPKITAFLSSPFEALTQRETFLPRPREQKAQLSSPPPSLPTSQ